MKKIFTTLALLCFISGDMKDSPKTENILLLPVFRVAGKSSISFRQTLRQILLKLMYPHKKVFRNAGI
jgi:hypothetical protein